MFPRSRLPLKRLSRATAAATRTAPPCWARRMELGRRCSANLPPVRGPVARTPPTSGFTSISTSSGAAMLALRDCARVDRSPITRPRKSNEQLTCYYLLFTIECTSDDCMMQGAARNTSCASNTRCKHNTPARNSAHPPCCRFNAWIT